MINVEDTNLLPLSLYVFNNVNISLKSMKSGSKLVSPPKYF